MMYADRYEDTKQKLEEASTAVDIQLICRVSLYILAQ